MTTQKGEMIRSLVIAAPNFQTVQFGIVGTAPLVMHKFSLKAKNEMKDAMGKTKGAKMGKKDPVNWDERLDQAIHYSTEGWIGIPCSAFRAAAISACRIVGFKMTLAKLGIFIRPDGIDREEGTPLIKLNGDYQAVDHVVRLAKAGSSTIVRRPMWEQWNAVVTVDYDGDMFSSADLYNLFMRVGLQVGLLEGRPDSTNSTGMGWGTFKIDSMKELR